MIVIRSRSDDSHVPWGGREAPHRQFGELGRVVVDDAGVDRRGHGDSLGGNSIRAEPENLCVSIG